MRISNCGWKHVLVASLVLLWSVGANAQRPESRGSAKVEPALFNPFDVGLSRLQLNPFGSFEISPSAATSVGSSAASSSSAAQPSTTGRPDGVPVGPVRRPITPPGHRSPFQPPGPPHDPPGPPHDPPGPPSNPPPTNPPGRR